MRDSARVCFRFTLLSLLLLGVLLGLGGCYSVSRNPATGGPVEMGDPERSTEGNRPPTRRPPSEAIPDPYGLTEDEIRAMPPEVPEGVNILDIGDISLAELNDMGFLEDIRFSYDSADLAEGARAALQRNAEWLDRYPTTRIMIEGHCDERGTVEYNLALGEERARATRDYLAELGIASDRMRIITYGKEFPLDPAHTEDAWSRNRRAHLEIVAK